MIKIVIKKKYKKQNKKHNKNQQMKSQWDISDLQQKIMSLVKEALNYQDAFWKYQVQIIMHGMQDKNVQNYFLIQVMRTNCYFVIKLLNRIRKLFKYGSIEELLLKNQKIVMVKSNFQKMKYLIKIIKIIMHGVIEFGYVNILIYMVKNGKDQINISKKIQKIIQFGITEGFYQIINLRANKQNQKMNSSLFFNKFNQLSIMRVFGIIYSVYLRHMILNVYKAKKYKYQIKIYFRVIFFLILMIFKKLKIFVMKLYFRLLKISFIKLINSYQTGQNKQRQYKGNH
ncbi:hypothetical protein IMG5_066210 [Ichthyophthirius multifiliis]|uniref:Transmembrane protein n=1 Tax=Ichthyophthirius multifiliis TaxID=5932 RepID=G0QPC0_ICHMU|nr:hypothetical protein IMG5_066210 [Ichthyophthirius multifiliis]EGR32935.1 hypothetical protein IMG5_066210 [Ichthyophthirius multifiliis]|eukprot:XP_004036921.1 hypothetical protein IMG5_066210 [Ichthyophthirius multifiliis]